MRSRQDHNRIYWGAVCLLSAALVTLRFLLEGLGDSDFYWHVTLGRKILELRRIPKADIFSWISPELGLTETAHSWLAGILLYLCTLPFKRPEYGAWLYLALCAVSFTLILIRGYRRFAGERDCAVGRVLCGIGFPLLSMAVICTARPQSVGLQLMLAGLFELEELWQDANGRRHVPRLALLSLLLANLHGGTVPLLFAFTGLYFGLARPFLQPLYRLLPLGKRNAPAPGAGKALAAALLGEGLAGLLNPYGGKLYIYFFVTNNDATKRFITEWQRVDFSDYESWLNLALPFAVLLAAALLFRRIRPLSLREALCVAAMLAGTALRVRLGSYAALTLAPYLIRCFAALTPETRPRLTAFFGKCLPAFAALALVLALCGAVGSRLLPREEPLCDSPMNRVSEGLQEALAQADCARLYTSYNDGGLVLFLGGRSFIDSRADLFPEEVLTDGIGFSYMDFEFAEDGQNFLDTYRFDGALLDLGYTSAARDFLDSLPDWQRFYEDDNYVLYVKNAAQH